MRGGGRLPTALERVGSEECVPPIEEEGRRRLAPRRAAMTGARGQCRLRHPPRRLRGEMAFRVGREEDLDWTRCPPSSETRRDGTMAAAMRIGDAWLMSYSPMPR